MRLFIFIICVGFSFSLLGASANADPSTGNDAGVLLPPLASGMSINNGVSYLFETDPIEFEELGKLPPSRWTVYPGKVVNFETVDRPVWLRFEVINSIENSSEWLLKVRYPFLDYIKVLVYHPKEKKWDAPLISGLTIPMQLRPVAHRNFLFPLTLDPGQKSIIFVRVVSRARVILPLILWKADLFTKQDAHNIMLLGIYFGILAVMLVYNISISIFTRDKSYLFYSFYILTILLYTLMNTGVGTQYIWDGSYWLKTHGYGILPSLCFLGGILFVREFLSLKQYGGWIYKINNFLIVFWVAFIVFYILGPPKFLFIPILDFTALVTNTAGLFTGVFLWMKGNTSARYFTIAWSSLMFFTFLLVLGNMGVMEFSWFSSYSQMVGFVVELVLLSFALSDRINQERLAREEAQKVALNLNRKISRRLEKLVHERTIDLKKALLRLKKVNQELSELTITDSLTKVYNRRFFEKFIAHEVKRANRTLRPLAVIMVDIDHFKSINDTHGHPVGDKCLYLVARTLRRQMARSVDLVARYGGEEFVVVLTATPKEKAILLAEKVRLAVERLGVINKGVPIKLRVSLGVASWIPDQDESYGELVKAADQALYQAKHNGRNQVAAYNIHYHSYLN